MRELVRPERTVRQKQRSERPKAVVAAVESAVETFLRSGRIIARENPDNQQELLDYVAVAEVEEAGQNLIRQSWRGGEEGEGPAGEDEQERGGPPGPWRLRPAGGG